MELEITPFFDPGTFCYSYVVTALNKHAVIIDAVLNFDPVAVRTTTSHADQIIGYAKDQNLTVDWILETHVHADHLSAAQYIKQSLGGQIAIGRDVQTVQVIFSQVFNAGAQFATNGSQFDRLLDDDDRLSLGDGAIEVLHTPGHTPACVTYLVDGHAFVGDTLFMPDYGTARTDFPGGDASQLYQSIQKILALPPDTKLYMCHDYGTDTRTTFQFETTVEVQKKDNIHINDSVTQQDFVQSREDRDAQLAAPRLLYPAVQFNMRAGAMPPADDNGRVYLKLPVHGS
jgi:glyoxylase-like metal-dependent hydrolase (beta-lactamase superfamily II)